MDDILSEIVRRKEQGERMALASLVWSTGSIPMSERAKMIVAEHGDVVGTIGGGCLEAEVLSAGRTALNTGENQLLRYTMTEKQAGESGLNCGGSVRIYTEVIEPDEAADFYGRVLAARQGRRGCALATVLNSAGEGRLWLGADGSTCGSLGTPAADLAVEECLPKVLGRERGLVCELGAGAEVFIEPFLPEPVLYVFGGGHVGGQICALAKNVGFRVVLIDDRPAFANSERHPLADECLVAGMEEVFAYLPIDAQSYIIAATRGHQHDEVVVEAAIETPARYIGMLGSERKKLILWRRIAARGGNPQRLDAVFAPIGVNIGADTPAEIAVSVVAELIEQRRGTPKAWKTKRTTHGG